MTIEEVLEDNWFNLDCESPLEISNKHWDVATWIFANIVIDSIKNNNVMDFEDKYRSII